LVLNWNFKLLVVCFLGKKGGWFLGGFRRTFCVQTVLVCLRWGCVLCGMAKKKHKPHDAFVKALLSDPVRAKIS
jgi:hypothetical protein